MKRSLLSITLILCTGVPFLYGQVLSGFGAKAGISFANQGYMISAIDYRLETEVLAGPAFSLFMEAFKTNHLSMQVDLSYFLKGSRTRTQSVTVDHTNNDRILVNEGELSTSRFSYLSIAPMARYTLGKGALQPSFLLGPRVDILLKYKTDSDYPLEDQNSVIPGFTFGTGLEYRLGKLGLFAELYYHGDFMPVNGKDPLLVKNQLLSLCLGVRRLAGD